MIWQKDLFLKVCIICTRHVFCGSAGSKRKGQARLCGCLCNACQGLCLEPLVLCCTGFAVQV